MFNFFKSDMTESYENYGTENHLNTNNYYNEKNDGHWKYLMTRKLVIRIGKSILKRRSTLQSVRKIREIFGENGFAMMMDGMMMIVMKGISMMNTIKK